MIKVNNTFSVYVIEVFMLLSIQGYIDVANKWSNHCANIQINMYYADI